MLLLSPCLAAGQKPAPCNTDAFGDPLPQGALARIGTIKYRVADRNSARLAPDGKLLAVHNCWSGDIELWDVPAWNNRRVLRIPSAEKSEKDSLANVEALRFSPDGKTLAAFDERHERLLFFDLATAKCTRSFSLPKEGRCVEVVMAPAGHKFVAAVNRGGTHQWTWFVGDVASGTFQQVFARGDFYLCFAISEDCRWATVVGEDLTLVDLATGQTAWRLKTDYPVTDHQTKTAAFSRDGKRIVVASEASVRIYDAATGKELCNERPRFSSAPHWLYNGHIIAHTPDGKSFYLRENNAITTWDAYTAKQTATHMPPNREWLQQLVCTADGKVLALAGDSVLYLWDVVTEKMLSPVDVPDRWGNDIRFSPEGKLGVVSGYKEAWWNPRTSARLTEPEWKPVTPLGALKYNWSSPRPVLLHQGAKVASLQHDTVRIWETVTGQDTARFSVPLGPAEEATLLAASDQGRYFALATFETARPADSKPNEADAKVPARLIVWDQGKKAVVRAWKNDLANDRAAVLSPDGRWLAYVSLQGKVQVRRVAPAKDEDDFELDKIGDNVQCLAFSPDGKQLACATASVDQRKICLCDTTTGKISRVVHADPYSNIYCLAYSHDGSLLAGNAHCTTVLVWETGLPGSAVGPVAVEVPAKKQDKAKPTPQVPDPVVSGDPLPSGALLRLGTTRYWLPESIAIDSVRLSPKAGYLAGLNENGAIVTWKLPAWTAGPSFRPTPSMQANVPRFKSFAFTGDGSLAAYDSAHRLAVFDPATGKCLRVVALPAGFRMYEADLAVSPDRRTLVCSGNTEKQTHETLIWDLDDNKLRHAIRLPFAIYSASHAPAPREDPSCPRAGLPVPLGYGRVPRHALSADCRWLAIGNLTGKDDVEKSCAIELWDCATGKPARRIDVGSTLKHMVFSPDGKWLAVRLAWEPTIRIYETAGGKEVHNLRQFVEWCETFAFAPDGKSLFVAENHYSEYTVREWSLATGLTTATFSTPCGCEVQQFAFLPNGAPVAVAVVDRMVYCWEPVSQKLHSPAGVWRHPISTLYFSEQGELFVGSQGGQVFWWNARTGGKLRDVKLEGLERAWSQDRLGMAAAGDIVACFDGCPHHQPTKVWLSDLRTGKLLCYDETSTFQTLSLYANGQKAASLQSNVVRIWDPLSGRDQSRWDTAAWDNGETLTSMRVSENGRFFAFGSRANRLILWDHEKRAVLGTWPLDSSWPRAAPVEKALCFSADSRWLIFPEAKNRLRLIRTDAKWGAGYTLHLDEQETVTCLVFSPDGRELACGIMRQTDSRPTNRLMIYELVSRKVRSDLVGHDGAAINCLAYSADGTLLASGSDDATVLIWQNSLRGAALLPKLH
jgi:WD40 repeat protein